MARVVIIGIDGMDFSFVKSHLDDLPNLQNLATDGFLGKLNSVYPPDSIPSWITIYTGQDPAEHGIVKSVDYLKKNYKNFSINTDAFRGKTFWDAAGQRGKKVCVINPFMCYPVWPVNGIMINGPIFISGDIQSYPENILHKHSDVPPLGGITDFPTQKTLPIFIDKTLDDTKKLAMFAKKFDNSVCWDLFFVSFFTLDRIQHFLWRFSDKEDPTYPGSNPYEDVILRLYCEFDKIIGSYLNELNSDDVLLILSDHGHGMRCTKTLNLNEFLRRRDYLHLSAGRIHLLNKKYWIEKAKNYTLQLLFVLQKEEWAYYIAKLHSNPKALKTSAHLINKSGSTAYLSDFAGMGPFGGISLNQNDSDAYKAILNKIIADLEELNNEYSGRLFKWIEPRSSIIRGTSDFVYPDILFELHDGIGVNWGVFMPLITRNPFHRRISGGHKMGGIIATNMKNYLDSSKSYAVKDIKHIVLGSLGINECDQEC